MAKDWRELVRNNDLRELASKKVTKQMSKEELEQRIAVFIKAHNMCVLATAKDNVPRATPIEYWSDGTTLYMGSDPGTKIANIKANPMVSVGIHDPYVGPLSTKGLQITGEAQLLTDENSEYDDALIMHRRERTGGEIGEYKPPRGRTLIKVKAKKIELLDVALKLEGYAARHVWEA